MKTLSAIWPLIFVIVYFLSGSTIFGNRRRERQPTGRLPQNQRPSPVSDPAGVDGPFMWPSSSPAFNQAIRFEGMASANQDDVDEGLSVEMPQEQVSHPSSEPIPVENHLELDFESPDLVKAAIWSEILQPPLSLRRSRH